jgi:hypothetical protein
MRACVKKRAHRFDPLYLALCDIASTTCISPSATSLHLSLSDTRVSDARVKPACARLFWLLPSGRRRLSSRRLSSLLRNGWPRDA